MNMTEKSILNKHPHPHPRMLKLKIRIRGCAKSDIRPIPKSLLKMYAPIICKPPHQSSIHVKHGVFCMCKKKYLFFCCIIICRVTAIAGLLLEILNI